MRIAYFGLPLGALLLARDGHELVYAGICRKGALGTRRLRRTLARAPAAAALEIEPDLSANETLARVRGASPDLVVSWFWTRRIPPEMLGVAPRGALGVHPSLLPRHRGPDPYFWAIDAGDEVTGVTAHLLAEDYDTGDVLGTKTLAVRPDDDAWTLARRLDRPSLALLREVVAAYAAGHPPDPVPQDDARATPAPEPDEDTLELRWNRPAEDIVRRVRAASPWPGAFTAIGDHVVVLTRVRATVDVAHALAPGEAMVRADGVPVVRAGDRGVELHEGRLEDEPEAKLDAAGLAAIVRLAARNALA